MALAPFGKRAGSLGVPAAFVASSQSRGIDRAAWLLPVTISQSLSFQLCCCNSLETWEKIHGRVAENFKRSSL
jgi:hypothetical protein